MSRITLLGVGCGIPDADRDFTSLVWHGERSGRVAPMLVDAGGSPYRSLLRAGIMPVSLDSVLLTHSHCDHVSGLAALLFSLYLAGRREPLPIYGLAPTLDLARRIVDAYDLEQYQAPVDWRVFEASDELPGAAGDDWTLTTAPTDHSRPCVALRFERASPRRVLVYSCDTAPCESVATLAQDADVLIHEATAVTPMASHTTAREAGEVAVRARAKSLVLVHYSPFHARPEAETLDAVRAGGFDGPACIGQEGMVLS